MDLRRHRGPSLCAQDEQVCSAFQGRRHDVVARQADGSHGWAADEFVGGPGIHRRWG